MNLELKGGEPLYRVALRDVTAPLFRPASAWYAGSGEMLEDFSRALEAEQGAEATALIQAGWDRQLLTVHHVSQPLEWAPFVYPYRSLWKHYHYIDGDWIAAQLAYVQDGARYFRFVLAEMENGRYSAYQDMAAMPMEGPCLGHPAMLAAEDALLYGRLMFLEREFKCCAAMQADIAVPAALRFEGFFRDYFGKE